MHEIEILTTDSLGDSSYLLTSGGEAALVDPQRDSWDLMESCARRRLRIRYVLETHVHNDYVSGALEVRAATGATVAGPARAAYDFDHLPLAEDDEIAFGDLTVRAMATPGHTAEHTSYLVFDDAEAPEDVAAVCTGGSLLVGNAGRTDLSGDARTQELARAQYRSLRRLALLPDATRVLPTHGAGSSCAAGPLSRERTTTVGAERRTNPALGVRDEEAFVVERTEGLPPYPAYYHHMAPINRHGPDVLGRLPALRPLTPAMVEGLIGGGARIVDGRDRAAFAEAHLPGSICDELDERFASLVGEVLPFGTRLVLILPEPAGEAAGEAVRQLLRIGFENIAGHLPGGVDTWAAAGRPVRTFRTADAAELAGRLDRTRVLDVRPERPEGGVPGTLGIPLAELPRRLGELPRDREIWTVCGSGRRATIAASLLDMAGIRVTAVTRGGVARLPRPA
ncbi:MULTISPECIES: MBL fold metallo-hydrolase [Streptomyces]|uniref:Rhodanese-like domain-containing protein n=1 Tax=Streptomyces solicathayae TaxID=3081768 RepID=A0ABZ0LPW2_9ACTN|nr:rhodanese-like domain-containing protein [Streptomyces sp. HUAS YS2]WOX20819.1 rhodanese-like domain-containing protein [Streptomyces sp. HUAS YS2]